MFGFKKLWGIFFILVVLMTGGFLLANEVEAKSSTIYLFHGEGCPHCADEIEFLSKWQEEKKDLDIKSFEVYYNRANADFMLEVGKALGQDVRGVPFTVVGDNFISGWYNEEVTGRKVKAMVRDCEISGEEECPDVVGNLLAGVVNEPIGDSGGGDNGGEENKTINLPIIGEKNIEGTPLILLTILIGGLDGFNPCASWALVFLIMLLLGMKDRMRMWILGVAFLLASAITYFAFISLWLNMMLLIGYVFWVRLAIGLTALVVGIAYLRKWKNNKAGVCVIEKNERKEGMMSSLKMAVTGDKFWLALIGVATLGILVNIFELFCSLGLPAIYSEILASVGVSYWQNYAYLLLYTLVYLLDDILIFSIAMITLKLTGISEKYLNYVYLVGGVVLIGLGVWIVF